MLGYLHSSCNSQGATFSALEGHVACQKLVIGLHREVSCGLVGFDSGLRHFVGD